MGDRLRRRSRMGWRGAVVGLVIGALAAGWWAGRVTFVPAGTEGQGAVPLVTAPVGTGSIGDERAFTVTVSQPFSAVAVNLLAGVITQVSDGLNIDQGAALYSVNNGAVRAVEGDLPFYRDLALGSAGADVEQLQRLLVDTGHLDAAAQNGSFDGLTANAVRGWQRSNSEAASGTVALGSVVALPALPTTVRLGESIQTGSLLAGGEENVLVQSAEPMFSLTVTEAQASSIPPTALIRVTSGESTWDAVLSGERREDSGSVALEITAPNGAVVCGDQCATLPAAEELSLQAVVEMVPEASGATVPLAAVHSDAEGAYLIDGEGTIIRVDVVGSGGGLAVVEGVEPGQIVAISGSRANDG